VYGILTPQELKNTKDKEKRKRASRGRRFMRLEDLLHKKRA
jgi:hypothetical protein